MSDMLSVFDQPNDGLFFAHLRGSEMHWFFVQGAQALRKDLYIPGVLSLINGIEATLRITIHQLAGKSFNEDLSDYKLLSNTLINQAGDKGMPILALAFPGESDFIENLATTKPNRVDVKIVALRNDLCHGNVTPFLNRELGEYLIFFTPECLRETSQILLSVSKQWVEELSRFRLTTLGY
ncbi:hypothetical protein QUA13_11175 [Microcoleus sp. S28C3]|uniref:hypothetical protein n=1 Tax=Microcoleus sp. S28C3 TaxID=3055414 RepID=UPI002FD326BE